MNKTAEKISLWIEEQVKNAHCKGVVFGLSGGIDSAVVAAICSMTISKDNIIGVIMPCGSLKEDEEDAHLVASQLGIRTEVFDLGNAYDSLSPQSLLPYDNKLANANLKARLRMATLYYYSNTLSYMVVGTGNKTEIMVGYGTKYGDEGVDIQPIGDLYKTEVFELAKELRLPEKIITKPPSAGLWIGQIDEEEMGITYEKLDKTLKAIEYYTKCGYNSMIFNPVFYEELCKKESISVEDYLKVQKMIIKSHHKRSMPPIFINN